MYIYIYIHIDNYTHIHHRLGGLGGRVGPMMVPRGDLSMYRSLLLLVMRTQSLPVHGTHICTYVHPPMDAKTHMYICARIWLKEDIQVVLLDFCVFGDSC